jgi:hypothetical protein
MPDPAELWTVCNLVKRRRAFYQRCRIATLVVPLTAIVNAMTSPNWPWSLSVALGSSGVLGFAAEGTFGRNLRLGRDWHERRVRQLLARQAR